MRTDGAGGRRRSAGFFWGLAAGILAALALVAAGDLGWPVLPGWAGRPASAGTATGDRPVTGALYLAGAVPPGLHLFVDGRAVEPRPSGRGSVVTVAAGTRTLEVRGDEGPLWSTRLDLAPGRADTLNPEFGGDVVVEVSRQAPTGALYVDDHLAGTAPGTVSGVAPGWHRITVRNGDDTVYEDACTVRPGEVSLVTVPARPPWGKGRVLVRSSRMADDGLHEEGGIRVSVDGAAAGRTPLELNLDAGFHSVRVDRDGSAPSVEVLYVEAGTTRYVNAQFGDEDGLTLAVAPPVQARAGEPLALPVRVDRDGDPVTLTEGTLFVIKAGQSRPVGVPLVASKTDPALFLALVPPQLAGSSGFLTGYASARDDGGHRGTSEIFSVSLR